MRATTAPKPSLARVQVPFGPFLALGALIDLFAGPAILRLLLGEYARRCERQPATSPMIVRMRPSTSERISPRRAALSASKRITSTGPVFDARTRPQPLVLPLLVLERHAHAVDLDDIVARAEPLDGAAHDLELDLVGAGHADLGRVVKHRQRVVELGQRLLANGSGARPAARPRRPRRRSRTSDRRRTCAPTSRRPAPPSPPSSSP